MRLHHQLGGLPRLQLRQRGDNLLFQVRGVRGGDVLQAVAERLPRRHHLRHHGPGHGDAAADDGQGAGPGDAGARPGHVVLGMLQEGQHRRRVLLRRLLPRRHSREDRPRRRRGHRGRRARRRRRGRCLRRRRRRRLLQLPRRWLVRLTLLLPGLEGRRDVAARGGIAAGSLERRRGVAEGSRVTPRSHAGRLRKRGLGRGPHRPERPRGIHGLLDLGRHGRAPGWQRLRHLQGRGHRRRRLLLVHLVFLLRGHRREPHERLPVEGLH
mmetsp:Transcript_14578/g.51236  ORF Transcript_14578/g.51236 Transcript_14578/m.51236 type:complete len:268 (+) Transcript_14578:1343-2146(+)